MDEMQKEIVKEAVKQIPIKEIYDDGVKTSMKAAGDVVGLLPRAINAALEPLHKWVLQKEYNIDETKKILQNKLNGIDPDLITPPDSYIGVPVLQAISYSMDSDELRDMYANLLASSMISETKHFVHPSFVEIIKQLSPLDAKLLNLFRYNETYPLCDIQEVHTNGKLTPCYHSLFDFKDKNDAFTSKEHLYLTASLDNLIRLGVVLKNKEIFESNYDYTAFENNFMYLGLVKIKNDPQSKLRKIPARIELTLFGKELCRVIFKQV